VRSAGIAILIAFALALQTTLARFLTPGANLIDLVFVAVVYIALTGGPGAGLIAGAVAGLAQDALAATGVSVVATGAGVATARSVIGIGGLAKTVIGFFTGIIGTQFIVARPLPRAFVFFTATVAHAIMVLGLYSVLDPGYGGTPYGAIASQAGANALAGVVIFEVGESLPKLMDRRRSSGGRMRINRRLD
jgi:cell shape-determining protein MreD